MASQAGTDDISAKWSNRLWSSQAVSDAITKSPKTVKLASTKDEVVVSIHKELLCFFSSYYSAALNGNFLEAQKDQFEVELSGGDLKSFATWIYTGDLSRSTTRRCSITLYIFADLVDIIALRHKTVSSLARGKLLEYDLANLVHDNLPPKSPLRRYMLDSYIAHWEPIFDDEDTCILEGDTDSDYRPANFTFHVMMGITFRTRKDPPGCTCCHDVCQYHEHLSKEEWQATCGQLEGSKMPASLEVPELAKSRKRGTTGSPTLSYRNWLRATSANHRVRVTRRDTWRMTSAFLHLVLLRI